MMSTTKNPNPSAPPDFLTDELLAELDAAARSLEELSLRGAELSLALDEPTGALKIQLDDEQGSRQLTPTQLFSLLDSGGL
jgi:hypothetical protein